MANIKKIKVSGTSYNVYDTTAIHNIATNPTTSIISDISNASYKSATSAVGIGYNSVVSGGTSVAVGASANAGTGGTAVGMQARAGSSQSAAFGFSATASSVGAVQLGQGTNSTQYTLQFRTFPLVDENGKIPMERLHSDLIVTTTDPLPEPNSLSVATAQLYQGADGDEFKKDHMYVVAEDSSLLWGMIMQYTFQIVPEPAKNIKVDMQKFLNWVKTNVGHFQGVANFTTPTSSSTAIQVIYQAATGHFLIAVSGFVFEYASSRQVDTGYTTLQEIKDNLGIEINPEVWNPQPTMPPVPFMVIAASTTGFGVVGPLAVDQTAPNSVVISDPEKFTAKLRSTITGDTGEQYTMKFDRTEQISFWRTGSAQWGFTVVGSGQTKVTVYAISQAQLLSEWGINVLLPDNFIRLQMIQLVNTFGHRWTESGLDLKNLEGYSTTGNQVLKNVNGAIQWGIGGEGGGSSRNIGDIFYTTRNDESLNGSVECNGGTYSTADYEGTGSIGELLVRGKLDYISLSDYATAINTKGYCDKIGWDGTGTTAFRVPTLTPHIIQKNNIPVVGNGITLGLTTGNDIYFGLVTNSAQDGSYNTGGYGQNAGSSFSGSKPTASRTLGVTTDPEKSGIIADTTNTAQLRVMFQLFNSTTDEAVATVGTVVADVSNLKDMSNITATGKETVVGWGMPDYTAGVDITFPLQASPYIAPANGFVAFNPIYNNGSANLYINNTIVANKSNAGNYRDSTSFLIPVSKNDVVYWTANASSAPCKFFPSKQ